MSELTFEQWMKKVDNAVGNLTGFGLSTADLPDMCFHDRYSDGYSPSEVARELLEEEGFPFED